MGNTNRRGVGRLVHGGAKPAILIALAIVAAGAFAVLLARGRGGGNAKEVVLYTSVDSYLIAPVTDAFTAKTGVVVKVVGDTEATKTTGLIERLLAEKAAPRCDVWWSSEALGTITLAGAGLLEPWRSEHESEFPGGWPAHLRAADGVWYGFAQRARVIAYNTNRVKAADAPTRLRELIEPRWSGKVGMARPQFGTTRTQIAALVAMHGESATKNWIEGMRRNGVRMYNGNSSVVQALSVGEIEVGLTDSDDVHSGLRNGWPVAMVLEAVDDREVAGLPSPGPVVIPNTVGRIRGGPHPAEGGLLAEFLLSADVERILARSDSRNAPIREAVARETGVAAIPNAAPASAREIASHLATADRLIAEFFPIQ